MRYPCAQLQAQDHKVWPPTTIIPYFPLYLNLFSIKFNLSSATTYSTWTWYPNLQPTANLKTITRNYGYSWDSRSWTSSYSKRGVYYSIQRNRARTQEKPPTSPPRNKQYFLHSFPPPLFSSSHSTPHPSKYPSLTLSPTRARAPILHRRLASVRPPTHNLHLRRSQSRTSGHLCIRQTLVRQSPPSRIRPFAFLPRERIW